MAKRAEGKSAAVRRFHRNLASAADYAGWGGWLGPQQTSGYPAIDPADVNAIRALMDQYTAGVGNDHWKRFTGTWPEQQDKPGFVPGTAYEDWTALHFGFRQFVYKENPDLYTKMVGPNPWTTFPAGVQWNPYLFQTAVGPDYEIINGDPGTLSDAVAYADAQMSHFHDNAMRKMAIAIAAAIGGAAAAGAFAGSDAAATVADTAVSNVAAGSELTEITLPASAVYLPTSVAPTVLSESASLLTMPVFDAGAAATLADQLVNAVNTPEMQAAIAEGAVPPIPDGLGSNAFTQWATSTGVKYLEQQLGRALTPQEQMSVEDEMAAEIRKLQAQLAQNPNAAPYMGSTDWSALLPYLAIGGAIIFGTSLLAS